MPQLLNFSIYQGDTFVLPMIWRNADMTPRDLTGADLRMQFRESANSSRVVLELTLDNGRIQSGGATGQITLLLSPVESAALPAGPLRHDLEATFPSGIVETPIAGECLVVREVTR